MYEKVLSTVSELVRAQQILFLSGFATPDDKDTEDALRRSNFMKMAAHQRILHAASDLQNTVRTEALDRFAQEHSAAFHDAVILTEQDGAILALYNQDKLDQLNTPVINELSSVIASLVEILTAQYIAPGNVFPGAPLVTLFSSTSKYIFDWLSKSPETGETTITDWLFHNLSLQSEKIRYKKFSPHQEGRLTGADVELWFVDGASGICLRIQAKKLYASADNYNKIAYTTSHGLQIEKLTADATECNAIPFYLIYFSWSSYTPAECVGKLEIEKRQGAHLVCAHSLYSTFIASGRKKALPNDVLREAHPIPCILCPDREEGIHDVSLEGVYVTISTYWGTSCFSSCAAKGKIGWHDVIPLYVAKLRRPVNLDAPNFAEEMESSPGFPRAESLVVIDLSR